MTIMCGKQFQILTLLLVVCAMRSISQDVNMRPLRGNGECPARQKCVKAWLCKNGFNNKDGSFIIGNRTACPLLQVCCSTGDKVEEPVPEDNYTPLECGYRNPNGVGFILTGTSPNEAHFGEFPWMVAILSEEKSLRTISTIYTCGGSLITPKVILTAAHCVHTKAPGKIKARAGEWESNVDTELHPHQERQVAEIIVHELFDQRTLHFDIALLFVEKPFDLAPNVNTVCLPPADANFDPKQCYVTGWRKDKFQNGEYQNILKKIDLPVLPKSECEEGLRTTILGSKFELHETFLCAGGELEKDTCTGDGGSPLVCPMINAPNRYYQVGIDSWGIGCGELNEPAMYANIPSLRAWLDYHLERKREAKSFYTP